ncbi:hypothetical protein ACJX0J_022124, partial [Zea mays]
IIYIFDEPLILHILQHTLFMEGGVIFDFSLDALDSTCDISKFTFPIILTYLYDGIRFNSSLYSSTPLHILIFSLLLHLYLERNLPSIQGRYLGVRALLFSFATSLSFFLVFLGWSFTLAMASSQAKF